MNIQVKTKHTTEEEIAIKAHKWR